MKELFEQSYWYITTFLLGLTIGGFSRDSGGFLGLFGIIVWLLMGLAFFIGTL